MGNKNTKGNKKNFFTILKNTTSYRDFIIKMNQLISRDSTNWDFSEDSLNQEEINLFLEKIENFFFYSSDFIFEQSVLKKEPEKKNLQHVSNFLKILKKISILLLKENSEFLFEMLFKKINKDQKLKIKKKNIENFENSENSEKSENLENFEIFIDDEKFEGENHQIPLYIKLIYSLKKLFSQNEFSLKKKNISEKNNWSEKKVSERIIKNRNILLEFLLVLILIEKKFLKKKNLYKISILEFFIKTQNSDIILKNILGSSLNYAENGIIPYSSYFYKDFLEDDFKNALLCLIFSLFLLKEKNEKFSQEQNPNIFITKKFISQKKILEKKFFPFFFKDKIFLKTILILITENLNTYFEKENTILPNSYTQSPIIEEIILLLLCLINKNQICITLLNHMKKDYNILMNLIIICDKTEKNLQNPIFYSVLSIILKLTSSFLKR